MFCTQCGTQVGDKDIFCRQCGASMIDELSTSPTNTTSPATQPQPESEPFNWRLAALAVGISIPLVGLLVIAIAIFEKPHSPSTEPSHSSSSSEITPAGNVENIARASAQQPTSPIAVNSTKACLAINAAWEKFEQDVKVYNSFFRAFDSVATRVNDIDLVNVDPLVTEYSQRTIEFATQYRDKWQVLEAEKQNIQKMADNGARVGAGLGRVSADQGNEVAGELVGTFFGGILGAAAQESAQSALKQKGVVLAQATVKDWEAYQEFRKATIDKLNRKHMLIQ